MRFRSSAFTALFTASLTSLTSTACFGGDTGDSAPVQTEPGPDTTPSESRDKPGSKPSSSDDNADAPGVSPGEPQTDPDEGINFGNVPVRVESTSSSKVELSWDAVPDADRIRILIGPEPQGNADEMPVEVEEAELEGGATSHTIEGIAARTDLFIRVVAETPDGDEWGIAHARTTGGPRSDLDTPLRSVHAMAPNVLMLVLETRDTVFNGGSLSGSRGPAWQAGTWAVTRADGTPVGVSEVHRRSIPVGQPDYPVGYDQWGDQNVVDVDDHIFLVLDEEIGSTELLSVAHSGGSDTNLEVTLPFSDRFLESPLIKVNQVGYNPRASRRYAYVYGYLGDGGQVNLGSLPGAADVVADARNPLRPKRTVVGDLPLTERASNDDEAGGPVVEIDLADVPASEGARYRVRIPGVGISFPTAVSEEAALKSFYVVTRGLFHNRWCGDLSAEYTDWSRPADHCSAYFVSGHSYRDEFFPESTPKTNERAVVGGHHDAGDFDIRPFHVVVAQYLMRAFETNQEAFSDGQLDIPESGNGIPDLLDEALWSISAWEALQNENGSVRAGVESSRHPRGVYYASDDQLDYWTFNPEPWHTAYVAGLFAQASYLVKPFSKERAAELAGRAERAYAWAESQSAPREFLMYAAGELARATGDASYAEDYEASWSTFGGGGLFGNLQTWSNIYPGSFNGNSPLLADYTVGYVGSSQAQSSIVSATQTGLIDNADTAARSILDSSHAMRNGRPNWMPPDWGNSVSTAKHADPIYQALGVAEPDEGSAQDYFDALSLSADYVLGANPAGMAYITGLGTWSPQEPLHTDSLAFIKNKGLPPVPGIPVYGPVQNFPGPSYYDPVEAAFYPAFSQQPMGLHHVDARVAVNMSEFSVWETQAPLAALFATLAPGLEIPNDWKAGQVDHRSPLPGHRTD